MTLLDIRKQTVHLSGRYDLVTDTETYSDNGLDFFIQAGQRMLDNKVSHGKSFGEVLIETEVGHVTIPVPNLASITGVEVVKESGRVSLTHSTLSDVNRGLIEGPSSGEGVPRIYAITTNVRQSNLGNLPSEYEQLAIKIYPKPDGVYTLYIHGRLQSSLKEDSDESYWSLNYPELLITATLYQIERFHRNTQGMNDYLAALEEDIRNIENNYIETEVGSVNQMSNSFEFRGRGNVR